MKKYMLSAILALSCPQIIFAETNIETQQSNQQIHDVNDWLSYQEFSHKMQQMQGEYQKKFEDSIIHDLDERYERMEKEGQKQNIKLMQMVDNLQPQSQELTEIKRLWLDLLQSAIKGVDEASNSEHDDIDTNMEKINTLDSTLEVKVFQFIQQQNPPEYISDWIRYTQLKSDMKKKHNALEQSLNSLLTQTSEQNKIKLQQDFIQKITQTKLEMLHRFKTNSSELKNIITLQIQVIKAAEKMNLNVVSNAGISADEMNNVSEISDQIEKFENHFKFKIIQYVRSIQS